MWEPTLAVLGGALRTFQSKKGKETTAFTANAMPGTPGPPPSVCIQIHGSLPPTSADRGLGAVPAPWHCPTSRPKPHPSVSEQQGTCLESSCKGSWQSTFSISHLQMGGVTKVLGHQRRCPRSTVGLRPDQQQSFIRRGPQNPEPMRVFSKLGGNYGES